MVNVSQSKMVPAPTAFKGPGDDPGENLGAGATLLVVDVQERLAPAIAQAPEVVPRIIALIEKARGAGLPILATEQYSRGLGPTVAPLRGLLAHGEVVEKIHFAASREEGFCTALTARGITRCLVVGMEAHVCVLQTALALLARGVAVTLVADAVASRDDLNRRLAVARLARAGAEITDSAALLGALEPPEALSP
jgi:nicotinamidase-related amidase